MKERGNALIPVQDRGEEKKEGNRGMDKRRAAECIT